MKTTSVQPKSVVIIETAEGVRFTLPLAGPVSRFLAWLIDELVIVAACSGAAKGLGLISALNRDLTVGLTVLAYFVIWVGYGIALEWRWAGQTIGKRAVKLRVMDATGGRLLFSQIAVRNLLRFVDALPFLYFIGGLVMLLNRRYQRLGDLVANTIVLRQRSTAAPDLVLPDASEKYNSFLEIPHLAARLRQQTPPELALLVYDALLRRDELTPTARLELFAQLADKFKSLVRFPTEIAEPLTDERYVRNALGVLSSQNTRRPLARR
jgi:uncharacterized RDD family membrane protein YckC